MSTPPNPTEPKESIPPAAPATAGGALVQRLHGASLLIGGRGILLVTLALLLSASALASPPKARARGEIQCREVTTWPDLVSQMKSTYAGSPCGDACNPIHDDPAKYDNFPASAGLMVGRYRCVADGKDVDNLAWQAEADAKGSPTAWHSNLLAVVDRVRTALEKAGDVCAAERAVVRHVAWKGLIEGPIALGFLSALWNCERAAGKNADRVCLSKRAHSDAKMIESRFGPQVTSDVDAEAACHAAWSGQGDGEKNCVALYKPAQDEARAACAPFECQRARSAAADLLSSYQNSSLRPCSSCTQQMTANEVCDAAVPDQGGFSSQDHQTCLESYGRALEAVAKACPHESQGGASDAGAASPTKTPKRDTQAGGVTDETFRAAGLEWQRTPSGEVKNATSILPGFPPPHIEMGPADAPKYCTGLSLAGGGWRTPTKDELLALYREKALSASVAAVPGMQFSYWSSSTGTTNDNQVWVWKVYFGNGSSSLGWYDQATVRCVR